MALKEDNSGAWRVGVLFSNTGVTSTIERTQLNATLLAIEEINAAGGVLGRPIEPVMYDPASDPKQFRNFAERLFQLDAFPPGRGGDFPQCYSNTSVFRSLHARPINWRPHAKSDAECAGECDDIKSPSLRKSCICGRDG